MKKTINISLASLGFTLEEDAYQLLDEYLQKVKLHFSVLPESVEIVSDIESRLAEQLVVVPGEGKIVTLPDVHRLISNMGTPEQFGTGSSEEKTSAESSTGHFGKKLYRSNEDVVIAGVASGLANYLGLDPVWLRLIFGLSLLAGGFGFAVYIILWIVLPEAKSEIEKMQMRGEKVNLANLESIIKERVAEAKNKDRSNLTSTVARGAENLGRATGSLGNKLGHVLVKVFKVVFGIVGACISLVATVGMVVLIISVVSLALNINSPYVEFPFEALTTGVWYYVGLVSAFFVVFVPLLLLLLLGTSMITKKTALKRLPGFSLLGLWVVALILLLNTGVRLAPEVESIRQTSPYFKTTTKTIALKDFSQVDVANAMHVVVKEAPDYKLEITGKTRDVEDVSARVVGGQLKLSRDDGFRVCIFCWQETVLVTIEMPKLESASASGASRLEAASSSEQFRLKLSGASRAGLTLASGSATLELSGASRVVLGGEVEQVTSTLSGASSLFATEAKIQNVEVKASGASRASFGSLVVLKANASGASRIYYVEAGQLEPQTSGSGKVEQQDASGYMDDFGLEPIAPVGTLAPNTPPTPTR